MIENYLTEVNWISIPWGFVFGLVLCVLVCFLFNFPTPRTIGAVITSSLRYTIHKDLASILMGEFRFIPFQMKELHIKISQPIVSVDMESLRLHFSMFDFASIVYSRFDKNYKIDRACVHILISGMRLSFPQGTFSDIVKPPTKTILKEYFLSKLHPQSKSTNGPVTLISVWLAQIICENIDVSICDLELCFTNAPTHETVTGSAQKVNMTFQRCGRWSVTATVKVHDGTISLVQTSDSKRSRTVMMSRGRLLEGSLTMHLPSGRQKVHLHLQGPYFTDMHISPLVQFYQAYQVNIAFLLRCIHNSFSIGQKKSFHFHQNFNV